MPLLRVNSTSQSLSLPFSKGHSLRALLDSTSMRIRSGCRGTGACGLCRVRILQGSGNPATENERLQLSGQQLDDGIRLACQFLPDKDLVVELLNPTPPSNWKSLGREILRPVSSQNLSRSFPSGITAPLGVAVDLGTTNISLSLYDLLTGRRYTERHGINPQSIFGTDVMTRLVAAADSLARAEEMSSAIVVALAEALQDISSREGFDLGKIIYLTLVGNSAMLTLFTGENHELLLNPDMWGETIPCGLHENRSKAVKLGIHPDAVLEIIPPLAGFVGSDLLAGALTLQLEKQGGPALLIDFGTNTEIALWDGKQLLVTSAAGGPAFENGISCGMPADPGAIYQVRDRASDGLTFSCLEDVSPPRGLCGSGLVDLLACLRGNGTISDTGKFLWRTDALEYVLPLPETEIHLTKRDVDMMQRAKAAVAAGIIVLLEKAGLEMRELRRVCLAGAFGKYIRIPSGKSIGLLPDIDEKYFELCGNTALAGCEDCLLSTEAADQLEQLRSTAQLLNLSQADTFEELFFHNLYFRPMIMG